MSNGEKFFGSASKGWDGDESRRVMKTTYLKGRDGMPKIKALGNEPGEMRVSHLSPTRPGGKLNPVDDTSRKKYQLLPKQKQVKDTLNMRYARGRNLGIKCPISSMSGGTGDKGYNYVIFDADQITITNHVRYKMLNEDLAARFKEAQERLAKHREPIAIAFQTLV